MAPCWMSRTRHVRLHQALLSGVGLTGMAPDLYWECKRAVCSEEEILEELGANEHTTEYLRKRLELIETPDYLIRTIAPGRGLMPN